MDGKFSGVTVDSDTKILLLVDPTTEPKLIKEAMNVPDVAAVTMLLTSHDEIPMHYNYINQLNSGEYVHFPKVLEMIKPKKKIKMRKNID